MSKSKSNNTISFLKRMEHQAQVMELRITGHTFEQIGVIMAEREGREAPYSKQAIFKTVSKMLQDTSELINDEVDTLRALEAERLDLLMQKPFQMALDGNLGALDRVIKIMERRSKLLGLDLPQERQRSKEQDDSDSPRVVLYLPDNGRGPNNDHK